jgi:VanZ family protein
VVYILIIWIATLSPGNGKTLGHWDKVIHFLSYFFLSIPIALLHPKDWKLYSGLFFSILMGITIEYIQQYIPGRNFELTDILANSLGSISGIIITLIYYKKKYPE